ncbi:MAG: hypothetical protein ACJAZ2_000936, partial [Glaciecola sp.]
MGNLFSKASKLIVLMTFILSSNLLGQNELWYFGTGAGMAFTGPGFSPVSRPAEAAVGFYEALTTVGDGNGNVQWYTDGINVYDATHSIMPNGSGILGPSDGGTGSANQGVLTMPYPGSTTKFIMWTVPATDGTPAWGMRYHVIDMSLNGGLGDLASKNNLVSGAANVAEMLAGGRVNGDCNVMWAIAHETGTNNFILNKVEDVGGVLTITTNTQALGPIVQSGGSARGAMDISPDGTKIAICGGWPTGSHMFDFDATNGVISTHVDLGPKFVAGNQWRYGVFFSPDSKKIYFANGSYGVSPKLVQYNITLDALTTVYNGASSITEFAQGKDGVLYAGKTNGTSLAIMNNPDAATGGAAGFVDNGYALGSGSLNFGLPQYTYCFLNDPDCADTSLAGTIPAVCVGTGTIDLSAYNGASAPGTWTISASPGGVGDLATIAGTTFNINSTVAGTYTVRHTLTTPGALPCGQFAERSVVVSASPSVSVNSETICSDVAASTVTFTATAATATGHVWSGTGGSTATTPTTSGVNAGDYTVVVTDAAGCTNTATGTLTINTIPAVTVNSETICSDVAASTTTFTATAATATGHVWSGTGGSTATTPTTSGVNAGDYTVVVTDAAGCTNTATGTLTINTIPAVTVNSETICSNVAASTTTFTATAATATGHVWSGTGGSTATTPATSGVNAGDYTVVVTDAAGCTNTATGTLTINTIPAVTVNSETICSDVAASTTTFTATA